MGNSATDISISARRLSTGCLMWDLLHCFGRHDWIKEAHSVQRLRLGHDGSLDSPTLPGVFQLDSYDGLVQHYRYNLISKETNTINLRLASPSLEVEFEHLFLRNHIFSFSCPKALGEFLVQLSARSTPQYRSRNLRRFPLLHSKGEST